MAAVRARWMISPRTERELLVRCLLLTSHSSSPVLDDARVPVSANRYRCWTARSKRSRTFSSRVSHYGLRENKVNIRHVSRRQ